MARVRIADGAWPVDAADDVAALEGETARQRQSDDLQDQKQGRGDHPGDREARAERVVEGEGQVHQHG